MCLVFINAWFSQRKIIPTTTIQTRICPKLTKKTTRPLSTIVTVTQGLTMSSGMSMTMTPARSMITSMMKRMKKMMMIWFSFRILVIVTGTASRMVICPRTRICTDQID
jgi:hypothetical protein